jgi:ribonuclease Y
MTQVVLLIVGLAVGVGIGYLVRKSISESRAGAIEVRAREILAEAQRDAIAAKSQALVDAKDEAIRVRQEAEAEVKARSTEVTRRESRLNQKEETLDEMSRRLESRERSLLDRAADADRMREQLEEVLVKQKTELERLAGMTAQEARDTLIHEIQDEAKRDAMVLVRDIEGQAREEADRRARKIVAIAMQRVASEETSENAISVVTLPNDEMKGRIIGREGRNIRAFEAATGTNLIIDDTPESVILSCFDPIRREVARITLEKLIGDGRIQPSRIEEIAEKARAEVERAIREAGEWALMDVGITDMHPEMVKVLGRLNYRTSYGQNILKHLVEAAHIAGVIAAELGTDIDLAKRCTLLHDLGKAITHEVEGSHAMIGAELARRLKESPAVIHAIEAHHGEVEPAPAGRRSRPTSSACSASRRSPSPSTASRSATRCRRAGRSGSWCGRSRSTTWGPRSWPGTSPSASRRSSSTPVRSRSW